MKTPEEIKKGLSMCTHGADCGHCPYTLLECSHNQMEQDALAYIQQLEAQVPKWISVKERLPESKAPYCQTVNVYTVNGEVLVGFCNHGFWYVMRTEDDYCNDAEEGEVTHWMPLPEPPKEGDK